MFVHKQRFRRPLQPEGLERVRPIFHDFHLLEMEGDYEYPRHQHTIYEAILVENGPYRCELNERELTLVNGQVLMIKPGDWHSDHLHDGQRHYVVHFRLFSGVTDVNTPPVFRENIRPEGQICCGDYARETWFLHELKAEAEGARAYAPAVQDALLSAMFWRLIRGLDASVLSPEFRRIPLEEAHREELVQLFSRYLTKNPKVSTLAREIGLSPRHFTNRSRALLGASPAKFLLRLKIERAEELLRYHGMRVGEVSEELGFANPYHFSTVFRRTLGTSPRTRMRTEQSKNSPENAKPSVSRTPNARNSKTARR
jgi:AraC-like DNA-binding protein